MNNPFGYVSRKERNYVKNEINKDGREQDGSVFKERQSIVAQKSEKSVIRESKEIESITEQRRKPGIVCKYR
ncbi:hypothetical protein CANCADRAFT_31291 [Tortispora caseinolytica NRRL Y-17796]|uniref:Uncharacterized protein n=1 Tax=Tortispora caseinolytica NRRL Y-17796 TaxID=767744 RepID=A0A1E4TEZ1_9ASCO|nr:hypothetical protein CANCADRAFT_31291 [Tortispora caseinolytica NRRL Y-17796]